MPIWNIFYSNPNNGKIESFNVFQNLQFKYFIIENIKKNGDDKEQFKKQLRKDLCNCFFGDYKWDINMSHFSPIKNNNFKNEKINAYSQVMINFEIFSNYVWKNKNNKIFS